MLKQRILTALVLLALFIPAVLWLPPIGWAALTSAIVGLAAWKWAGLAQFGKRARLVYALGLFACLATLSLSGIMDTETVQKRIFLSLHFVLAPLFWFVMVPLWLHYRWPLKGIRGLVVGLLVVTPPWVTVYSGVIGGPRELILLLILSLIASAWVADIGAYFVDRKFGRHKLAPSINTGKTWEGVVGAFVAVFFYLSLPWLVSLTKPPYLIEIDLAETFALLFALLCAAAVCTAACTLGDLFASFLKYQANVKNNNTLLPSHGGVLGQIGSMLVLLAIWPVPLAIVLVGATGMAA